MLLERNQIGIKPRLVCANFPSTSVSQH